MVKEKEKLEILVSSHSNAAAELQCELDAKSGEMKTLVEERQIYAASIKDAEQVKRHQEKEVI